MSKYQYRAPAGSTIEIDGEVHGANESFDLSDERAEQIRREVPEVVPESEVQEAEAQAEEAQKQSEAQAEAERLAAEAQASEAEGAHPEQAPSVRSEGVQNRSRREGATGQNPAPDKSSESA